MRLSGVYNGKWGKIKEIMKCTLFHNQENILKNSELFIFLSHLNELFVDESEKNDFYGRKTITYFF